jgi:Spy/CpxP family protein refolding chaperone
MKAVRNMLVVVLVLAVAAPLVAQEKARKRGAKKPRPAREAQILPKALLEGLEFTAEQKDKLEELKKEVGPKLKEVRQKMESILTDEQKAARAEAAKAAKQAGKEGKEFREAVEAAVQLTDEQKAKTAEARKAMGEVQKEIREKFMSILTPEQQEAVKEKMKKARAAEGKKHREKQAAQ